MPNFVALVPETHINVSPGFVETLIQTRREEMFTGLMRLSYSSGENLLFTFLEGVQQKIYRCQDNRVDILPRQTWTGIFDQSNLTVGSLPLPVEAMRFARLVHEAPVLRTESFKLAPEELANRAGTWAADQDPSVIQIEDESIKKYYLIAGRSTPVIEELFFREGSPHFSISDTSFPRALPRGDYQVSRYLSNRENEAWREYELRLAFNPFMHMLLRRFSELAGRALTDRLCEQLSVWAHDDGWNITVNSNGMVNRHYFDSLESAVGVYVALLNHFRQEVTQAIGSRMMENTLREILLKLDPYRRELLTQYGVGSTLGVVWR